MDTTQVRKVAQVVLLAVAVVAASAAAYRFLSTREVDLAFGPDEEVVATPSRGPVGIRPNLAIGGWGEGTPVTVFLCAPDSTSHTDRCVELGQGPSGSTIPSGQVAAVPPTLGEGVEVTPATYVLRAGTGEGEEPYAVRGRFEVVPFSIGEPPEPRTYPAGARLSLSEPRQVAQGVACRVEVTPDNRIVVGSRLLDPGTGVITELPGVEGAELAWSPTGERLAIVTADRKEIVLAEPDGSAGQAVVREARGLLSSVTWAPEGDKIAYVARSEPGVGGGPGAPQVFVFSLVEGAQGALGPGESVAWSPGGARLAVEAAGGVIELVGFDGSRERVTEGRRPAWSPDGSTLALLRLGDAETGQTLLAPVEGPDPYPIGGSDVCAVAFSADGGRLVIARRSGEDTVLVVGDLTTER